MELNNKGKQKTIVNEEGSRVLQRNPKIQLYLEATNLKIKEDTFYNTSDEVLTRFVTRCKNEEDTDYLMGLAKYCSDNGLKLAPVVISSVLAHRGISFRDKNMDIPFYAPQRIAEAIALNNMKYVKLNNSFKKHALRVALEKMGSFTLRKNKMLNRKIKTKDLIKLLKPKPKDDYMSKLYKAIIENDKLSKLKPEESLVSMKSDSTKTTEDKMNYYDENIDKIPINQLVRNMKYIIEHADYKKQTQLLMKIIDRFNSLTDYKMLNIFDLIEASLAVPELEKPMHEVIKKFANNIKEMNKVKFDDKAYVLFDVSGSMGGQGEEIGFKYMILFALLYDNLNVRLFGNSIFGDDATSEQYLTLIREGRYNSAKAYFKHRNEGTALLDSVNELITRVPTMETLIVISDEVSWKEGSDLVRYTNRLNTKLTNTKLILINPTVSAGTVFQGNVMAIASLTPTIITSLFLFTKQNAFIEFVKNYEFKSITSKEV